MAQHFNCIMLNQAQITEMKFLDLFEQAAHAGRMYLNAEVIIFWVIFRNLRGGLPHTETDLEYFWRVPAECVIQVEHCVRVGDSKRWQKSFVGALLGIRNAPLA